MKRTFVADLPSNAGREVLVAGWMHTVRRVGKLAFLLLRDVSGLMLLLNRQNLRETDLFPRDRNRITP